MDTKEERFKLNIEFKNKNKNNQIVDFYETNVRLENLTYPKPDKALRVATINAHGFRSINTSHTTSKCVAGLIEFMLRHSIDVLGVEEYNSKHHALLEQLIKENNLYSTATTGWSYMNLIISRYPISNELTIVLPGDDHRFLVMGTIVDTNENEYKIGVTHLSILPRNYDFPDTDSFKESVKGTIDRHKEQLGKTSEYDLDILMGDFNFNRSEPEYNWMLPKWQDTSSNEPTTPFGTTVDFVWTHDQSPAFVLYSKYTDHRSVARRALPSEQQKNLSNYKCCFLRYAQKAILNRRSSRGAKRRD